MAGAVLNDKPATAARAATQARPSRTGKQHRKNTNYGLESQWQCLPDRTLLNFDRKGWVLTTGLLQQQQLQRVQACVEQVVQQRKLDSLRHRVRVLCPGHKSQPGSITSAEQAQELIQQHGSSQLGFLQFFNLHRTQTIIAGGMLNAGGARACGCPQDYAADNADVSCQWAVVPYTCSWQLLRGVLPGLAGRGLLFESQCGFLKGHKQRQCLQS
eukprot:GHRQ01015407.1.p1 GENE.GHRQ01015407.1~~GHRQ01015407.1.p1  ORF type:complete len:214 (+),score=40.74 GHRQ01015407.1:192-833(+)